MTISRLVQLQVPAEFRKNLNSQPEKCLRLETDVGLVLSPCNRYLAWWNRDLLLVYEGPDILLARKDFEIYSVLWTADASKLLVVYKFLKENKTSIKLMMFDIVTGNCIGDGEVVTEDKAYIVGGFWFEGMVCLVVSNASILLIRVDRMSLIEAISFADSYNYFTSCLTLSGTLILFGASRKGEALTSRWKLSSKYPHFQYEDGNRDGIRNPRRQSTGFLDRVLKFVFCSPPNTQYPSDTVMKSFRLTNCYISLSKDSNLCCFSNNGELQWIREGKIRYHLEEFDQITDLTFWDQDYFIISTSSGLILRDNITKTPTKPQLYPFTLQTIFCIMAIPGDRLYIHDNNVNVFVQCDPKELLQSYMSSHEYDKAYQLSVQFNLDSDLVLKEKWIDSAELNNWDTSILEQVKDKRWILETCMNSFPNSLRVIKQLFNFGLSLTNHISSSLVEEEVEKMLERLDNTSSNVYQDVSVVDFYIYRIQFLKRLDLLSTFEAVYSDILVNVNFSLTDKFLQFIKTDLVLFAMQQAKIGSLKTLEIVLTRHGPTLLPYRLSLLEKLPLTIPPSNELEKIMPSATEWPQIPWRRSDWAESKDLQEFAALILDDEPTPYFEPSVYPEGVAQITEWYSRRIERIVSETGQISYARGVCHIAVAKGIQLDQVAVNLGLLECAVKNSAYKSISLSELKEIPVNIVQKLVLDTCSGSNIEFLVYRVLHPYLTSRASLDDNADELQSELLAACIRDPLCLLSLCNLDPEMSSFVSLQYLLESCAYGECAITSLDIWLKILKCLKEQRVETSTPLTSDGWGDEDFDIQMEDSSIGGKQTEGSDFASFVFRLEIHVDFALFLQKHGLNWSLGQIKTLESENCKKALSKILRQSKILSNAADSVWNDTLNTLLDFIDLSLLNGVSETVLYTDIVVYALSEAKFQFVQAIFYPKTGTCHLPAEAIELLVLNAAVEFFDNDQEGDKDRGLMKLSRTCCTLLKPTIQSINDHLNLIEATNILVAQYRIKNDAYTHVLPIQIRLHKDRIHFLQNLLHQKPELYKRRGWLFNLLHQLLGNSAAFSVRSQYLIRIYMSQAAIQLDFLEDAYQILLDIVDNFLDSSVIFDSEMELFLSALIALTSSSYPNLDGKIILLSLSVTKCKASHASNLLLYWRKLVATAELDRYRILSGKSLKEAYSILLEERNNSNLNYGEDLHKSTTGARSSHHDFFKPIGANLSSFYTKSNISRGRRGDLVIEDTKTCLHLQKVLNQLEDGSFGKQDTAIESFSVILPYNSPLAISFLLTSSADNEEIVSLFDQLEPTSFHYTLAAYFFSLKASLLIPATPYDPFTVAFNALPSVILSAFSSLSSDYVHYEDIKLLISSSKLFLEKTKSSKVSHLRTILTTILNADPERVQADEKYRVEKILELAKTNVWKTLEAAADLAEQESVPISHIWREHAIWLFSVERSGLDINYEDSKSAIISHFDAIEPLLPEMHSELLASDNSERLALFYALLLDACAGNRLRADSQDFNQLSTRHDILNDLQARGIHRHVFLRSLIDANCRGVEGYLEIWTEFGNEIGIESFVTCLDRWTLIFTISCLKESFSNVLDSNIQDFKSNIISKSVFRYLHNQPWDSLDQFTTSSILEDAFQSFSSVTPVHAEELVFSLLTGIRFDNKTRELILSHSAPFSEKSERLDQQRELVAVIEKLGNYEIHGKRVPIEIIQLIEQFFCENREAMKAGLMKYCLRNFPSPDLLDVVCSSVSFDSLSLYGAALDLALENRDLKGIETLVLAVSYMEDTDSEFESDGWGIDDSIEDEREGGLAKQLKFLLQEKLEHYSLSDVADHGMKIHLLDFLGKYFVVKGRDTSHLEDAKIAATILSHWNITVDSSEKSLSFVFDLILEATKSPYQALCLLELLRDWPERVEDEFWIRAMNLLYSCGYIDLIVSSRVFSRLGPELISVSVEKEVLELLGAIEPQSNHYFLYGFLSSRPEVQDLVLERMNRMHADRNSYIASYRVACCLGFFPRLAAGHQQECILSVIEAKKDPISLPLIGVIIADSPGSTLSICRSWLGIGKGLLKGYRRWIGIEGKIIKDVIFSWDSCISSAIFEFMLPREQISAAVSNSRLDRQQLFHLVLVEALNSAAKKRVNDFKESHYCFSQFQ